MREYFNQRSPAPKLARNSQRIGALSLVGLSLSLLMEPCMALALPADKTIPFMLPIAQKHQQRVTRSAAREQGIITEDFSLPRENWLAGHRGIDFDAEPGTAVIATKPGSISFTGTVAGKPVVVLSHADGTRTTYEPAQTDLEKGTYIRRGEELAHTAQSSASHCSAKCLHIGMKINDTYLDPWVQFGGRVHVILKADTSG